MKTMEELLNSLENKNLSLHSGQEVEGKVISISDKEIILDLGTKSEGVLNLKDSNLSSEKIKIGDTLKAFVIAVENEHGQTILSLQRASRTPKAASRQHKLDLSKFVQAKNQKTKLTGTVLEVNKGGLILEIEGVRGFLPSSQIGISALGEMVGAGSDIVGQELSVNVIEIDQSNNRLIFSQKEAINDELKAKLNEFKPGQKLSGKVVAVYPFGLIVDINGSFAIAFQNEISWEKQEDPTSKFKVGQQIEVVVLSMESDFGRVNLSLKQTQEDPFTKLSEEYQTDDVISGTVSSVTPQGVVFSLKDGVEGFMPANKMETGANYEVGKKISVLVEGVDTNKRRINVAPFLTTTKDLIYK